MWQDGANDEGTAAEQAASAPAEREISVSTIDEGVGRLQKMAHDTVAALPTAAVGLIVLILFVLAGRAIQKGVQKYSAARKRHYNLVVAVGRLIYGAAIILGILVSAVIVFPNFTPTGMLTSLGVGSLVLGLAFKDVLQHYLAGILLLVSEPFRAGDQIVFREFEGTVEDVQTRATFIRTYDGRRVVIPNADLFSNSVTVNTAFARRRVEYDVPIAPGVDIEQARQAILDAIHETDTALPDPAPEAKTMDLTEFGARIRARWWVSPPVIREAFDARDKVLTAIRRKLPRPPAPMQPAAGQPPAPPAPPAPAAPPSRAGGGAPGAV